MSDDLFSRRLTAPPRRYRKTVFRLLLLCILSLGIVFAASNHPHEALRDAGRSAGSSIAESLPINSTVRIEELTKSLFVLQVKLDTVTTVLAGAIVDHGTRVVADERETARAVELIREHLQNGSSDVSIGPRALTPTHLLFAHLGANRLCIRVIDVSTGGVAVADSIDLRSAGTWRTADLE